MADAPHPNFAVEEATIRAFFAPSRRDRFVTLLAHPKRRAKALDALNLFDEFDERYVTRLGTNHVDLAGMLHDRGAPQECYVISDVPSIDARTLPVRQAIDETVSGGFASLLCCLPDRLACFIGEAGTGRWIILEKP